MSAYETALDFLNETTGYQPVIDSEGAVTQEPKEPDILDRIDAVLDLGTVAVG